MISMQLTKPSGPHDKDNIETIAGKGYGDGFSWNYGDHSLECDGSGNARQYPKDYSEDD